MFKDKLKGLINPEDGNKNNKKKIENLVFLVIILIVTIVIINIIWNGDKNSSNDKKSQNDTSKQLASSNTSSLEVASDSTNELEIKLEEILLDVLENEFKGPIIKSENFGHIEKKTVIPIGVKARIDTSESTKIKILEKCVENY